MSRSETINFALAIIGLTADTLGIYVFFFNPNLKESLPKVPNILLVEIIAISIYSYSWLVFSWILLRLYYKIKHKTKHNAKKKLDINFNYSWNRYNITPG